MKYPLCTLEEWKHKEQIEKANLNIKLLKKNIVKVSDKGLIRLFKK